MVSLSTPVWRAAAGSPGLTNLGARNQAAASKRGGLYQPQGFLAEAIQHALKADQVENAVDLAERIAPDYLHNGRINAYINLMSAFPGEALNSRPILRLYQARALKFHRQYNSAWDQLHLIEARMGAEMDRALLAELASLKALLATFTRPPDETIHFTQEALEILLPGARSARTWSKPRPGAF